MGLGNDSGESELRTTGLIVIGIRFVFSFARTGLIPVPNLIGGMMTLFLSPAFAEQDSVHNILVDGVSLELQQYNCKRNDP